MLASGSQNSHTEKRRVKNKFALFFSMLAKEVRPKVYSHGVLRYASGFSLKELEAANLNKFIAGANKIPVDLRRQTVIESNVALLKSLENLKQPKKSKKAPVKKEKKGKKGSAAESAKATPLDTIKGIKKAQIEKLNSIGINSVEQLLDEEISVIAKGTGIKEDTLEKWVKELKK